jgi:NAD(P) transhydrogenase
MNAPHFDLIVLGSGPAGEKGAAKAAYFGKRVALVEKEPVLGGAAANTGTLPSKTLRETALFLAGFRRRELYGLRCGLKDRVTVRDFLSRERVCKEAERARIHANLKRHRVTLYKGTAAFLDPHTVAVRTHGCPELPLHGDVFLIATGSYPYRPPVFPFQDPRLLDSDTILTLHEIPSALLVVGGGIIGCEYACTFAALGVRVAVVEKRERLLDFLDAEVAAALRGQMEAAGVRILAPDAVAEVHSGEVLQVRLQSGEVLRPDAVLVSSGRCGNTEALALNRAGVRTDARGRVLVNEHFQTNVLHVYAAGDVIGSPALASTSMEQARAAVGHAFGLDTPGALKNIFPLGIYTIPECSMAGETEEALAAQKVPYVVGRATYAANARGQIIGDEAGLLKLLFRKEDLRLLGVHILGEQATELVHIGVTALLLSAGAGLFLQTCYNYPTLSELYKYAAYDALGKASR